jgi:hypothetical protein
MKHHALELRADLGAACWAQLMPSNFPPNSFLAVITSINWREIWKYLVMIDHNQEADGSDTGREDTVTRSWMWVTHLLPSRYRLLLVGRIPGTITELCQAKKKFTI